MECLFCNYDKKEYILENNLAFGIYDKFPVKEGHILIMSKLYFENFFDSTDKVIKAMYDLAKKSKEVLDNSLKLDSYNIGYYRDQTIMHLRMHVIPRYKRNIKNPKGGIRRLKKQLVHYKG